MSRVRGLEPDDLDWVHGLARARRDALVPHAPRFWRPAADADARHRAFLAHQIEDDAVLTVRTDVGFLIAVDGERRQVVDDMAVADDAWTGEGTALLRHAAGRGRRLRFVVPAFEAARRRAAEETGLVAAEVWWHRDLPLVRVTAPGDRITLSAPGAVGSLVTAPPVYDPGGPVLLVTEVTDAAALAAVEGAAAARGATVSVVSQRPDDLMLELLLVEAGYTLTTRFFETPASPEE